MAEETTPFGNISTEEVYGIIGRLYTQLWAASNQANELSQGLALANQRIQAMEEASHQAGLQDMFDKKATSRKNQPGPQQPQIAVKSAPAKEDVKDKNESSP